MDQPAAPQSFAEKERPQPGLLKTIGILNILFGGVLLLCGLACLSVATPAVVVGGTPLRLDPVTTQAFFDEIRNERIKDLRAREKAAGTVAERDRIQKERGAVEARRRRVGDEVDLPKVNADLVWLSRYLRLDVLTGPVLNLLMIVAGIGLVLRKNWARVLGLTTATLKIVRLVALTALLVGVVIPRVSNALDALLSTEMGRQIITHAIEQQQARPGGAPAGPQPSPQEVVRMLRGFGIVSAIFFVCIGAIYPAIALILLSRPGARAACVDEDRSGDVLPGM